MGEIDGQRAFFMTYYVNMDEMNMMPDDFRSRRRMRHGKEQKNAPETIAVGLVATIGFGAGFFFFPEHWWLIFPMVFVGLMPLAAGIGQLFSRQKNIPEKTPVRDSAVAREKEILHAVSELEGTVSVLQIARATSLSIEEAQKTLDDFAKKGFASIEVDSSGIIRYEFQEFKKPSAESKYIDD